MHDETIELFKFLSRGNKLKIYSGNHVPANVTLLVCTTHPVLTTSNFEGVCHKCGCPVYFQDNRPELTKICIQCFLNNSKTQGVETGVTVDSIVRAGLVRKRN